MKSRICPYRGHCHSAGDCETCDFGAAFEKLSGKIRRLKEKNRRLTEENEALKNKFNAHLIDPSDDIFGAVLVCAERYSLGRRSYMPSLVIEFIRPLLPHLPEKTLGCLVRDLSSAEYFGDPQIDEPLWKAFYRDICEEIDKRKGEVK